MHEISLVRNILNTLTDEFPEKVQQIIRIHLKAGILSNVQPILMQNAFEAVIEDEPKFSGIKLEVEVMPILIYCDECHATTQVEQYKFVCSCGRPSKNIIQGDELMISQVEFNETI